MTTNSATCASLSSEDFENLSAVVAADPSVNPHDFLSACAAADVLTLIASEHDLSDIREWELEDEFDRFLDENYENVVIAGVLTYYTSIALKKTDPTAYRQLFLEYTDREYVEHAGIYFKADELTDLDRAAVLGTLAGYCVEYFELDEEVAEDMNSADTPMAFVAILKRLCLADVAQSASGVVSQDDRRRM